MRERLFGETDRSPAVLGVDISKPSGGVHQLGIPTVEDRIVQQALSQRITKRNRGRALGEVIGEVNCYAAGWLEYFRLAAT